MSDDREQELERLEKELLAEEPEDDLLADMPISLLENDTVLEDIFPAEEALSPCEEPNEEIAPEEELLTPDGEENLPEEAEEIAPPAEGGKYEGKFMKKTKKKPTKADQKREDKWLIGLMIAASFLCVGILGVLIYWMEAFLK